VRWMNVVVELEFVDGMRRTNHPSQLVAVGCERSCRTCYCSSEAAELRYNECWSGWQVVVCLVAQVVGGGGSDDAAV
jgi:hypothetical protein